jgi:hypothetical protein
MFGIRWLLLVCTCSLVTACGQTATSATTAAPQPVPSSSAVPTTRTTTSPPVDRAVASQRALAALAPEDGLAALGAWPPPVTEQQKIWALTEMCGGVAAGDYLTKSRRWETGGVGVYDTAYVYEQANGAEVVGKVRATAASCDQYRGSDGKAYVVYPDLPIDQPAGLSDSYAWCEGVDGDGFLCSALLARADVVVKITTAGHGERTYFVDALNSVIGIAAAPLLTL